MNDLYWRKGVKRSMSLLSFDGVCMCHGGAHFHLAPVAVANSLNGMFYPNRILVIQCGLVAIFWNWWSFVRRRTCLIAIKGPTVSSTLLLLGFSCFDEMLMTGFYRNCTSKKFKKTCRRLCCFLAESELLEGSRAEMNRLQEINRLSLDYLLSKNWKTVFSSFLCLLL